MTTRAPITQGIAFLTQGGEGAVPFHGKTRTNIACDAVPR
jgi:hypothetical protein